jgi:transcriptional regulator GlxA family with amidase domain
MTTSVAKPVGREVGFLLIPNFSMMAFTSAIEPLRAANRVAGRPIYAWKLISADGAPVRASNGIELVPHASVAQVEFCPMVVVVSGIDVRAFVDRPSFAWLRRLAKRGAVIGALSTASWILARAGLLTGRRCTIHWEELTSFTEAFPDLDVTGNLYEIDRDRFTCSGGTAALDLMLHLIAENQGHSVAAAVSEQFIHSHLRDTHEPQRMALRRRLQVSHPKLLAAIRVMEERLEEPLSTDAIARQVRLSKRQLERLFRLHLGGTPSRYYLQLRLERARNLLAQTSLSIMAVTVACGFVSAAHFSRSYKGHFGKAPRDERQPAPPIGLGAPFR